MNEIFPDFFTQIPSSIMKSKKLNSTDKRIYGVIYTMLNTTRKCFMSNARIANEISSTPKSVSRSITKLSRLGLFNVELTYIDGTKQVDKRFITLGNAPIPKNEHRVCTNKSIGMPINEQDNKSLNRLSDYGGGEAEKSLQAVANNFQKNIGVLNAKNIEDLRVWSEDMPLDVINYAIDIAADNNAQTFSYVNSILKRWYQSNIRTIEQAKASSTKNGKRNYGSSNKRKSKRGEIDEELGF